MKNKKEAKKYNQKLIVAIITVTLVLILGTSYAFFTLTLKAEKELSVTTGIFKIDYKDQNIISLENAYPMNDTKGMSLSPYEFSIENTGDINALYDISLELKESSNLDYKWLKYSIKRNEEVWSTPKKLTSLKLEEGLELEPSAKDTYQLRLWIDENTGNEAQGKVLIAKVVVNSVQSNASTGDITPPAITLNGDFSESIEQGSIYTDPGVESVSDDRDTLEISDVKVSYKYLNGETTEEIESIDTSRVGVYYIYYTIKDTSGNTGRVVRSVNVYQKDSRPPEIRLNGKAIVALNKGEHYEELGATARKEEEDLTSRIVTVGKVNEKRTETYEIKYLITDQIGNTASIVRIVNVISVSKEPVQELTIDLSKNPTEKITMEGENLGEITYTSSDETIAGVDSEGTITGVAPGETVIHIITSNGVEKEVIVKVVKTVTITYEKQGSLVSSIGKTSDSCRITEKDGTCRVTLPSISAGVGYTTPAWYLTNATSGTAYAVDESYSLTTNTTLYAGAKRNFTCASVGSTTTYAGKSWYTVANDGRNCSLALNTMSSSTGAYSEEVSKVTAEYFTSGSTLLAEKNAGLVTVLGTYTGTTGLTGSGIIWTGSESATPVNKTFTVYSNKYSDLYYSGRKVNDGSSDLPPSGSFVTAYNTSTVSSCSSVSNSRCVINNQWLPNVTTSNHGSTSRTVFTIANPGGNSTTFTATHRNYPSGNYYDFSQYELDIRPCGGPYHGQVAYRLTALSETAVNHLAASVGTTNKIGKDPKHVWGIAGVASSTTLTISGKVYREYNTATNSTCIPTYTYTYDNGTYPIQYRAFIRVKM